MICAKHGKNVKIYTNLDGKIIFVHVELGELGYREIECDEPIKTQEEWAREQNSKWLAKW